MEIPYIDDQPGSLRLEAFFARAVSEFDRRYAPGLSEETNTKFIDSVVKNAVDKLSADDINEFLSEEPDLIAAHTPGNSAETIESSLPNDPAALALVRSFLANDLRSKLLERASIQPVS